MIPYIRSTGCNNIISCNCDLAIVEGNTPLLISLVDIAIKNKKVIADLIEGKYTSTYLKDREDINFEQVLYNYGENKYRFRSENVDDTVHTIIYNTCIDNYCIDWNDEGISSIVTKFLRNKYYIPVTEEIVKKVIALDKEECEKWNWQHSIFKEINVYTNNPMFKNLKCYNINVGYFKSYLSKIDMNTNADDFDWNTIEDVQDYLYTFAKPIKDKLNQNIKVLYNPNNINSCIYEGKHKPFDGQVPIIQSAIEVLKRDSFVYIAAEMGTGKTLIGAKTNHSYFKEKGKLNYATLIVAPAITLTQWRDELKNSIGDKVDIIIIKKTVDFIKWYDNHVKNKKIIVNKSTYILVGKETFKLDSKKIPGVLYKKSKIKRKVKDDYWYNKCGVTSSLSYKTVNSVIETAICPHCGIPLKNPLTKNEDVYFTSDNFKGNPKKSNYKCQNCGEILWQSSYDKTMKTSLINFIKRKNIHFDSIIQDEIHQSNNAESIIGNASKTLLQYGRKNILLSGTTNNGYASNLHNIFSGLIPRKLQDHNVMDIKDFVRQYGTLQAINKRKDGEYHRYGRSQIRESDFKEIEGINPQVFTKYMVQNYIFATLDDLGKDLPPIYEYYVPIQQNEDIVQSANKIFNDIERANAFNAKMYEDSIIKHYVNNPFSWDSIHVEGTENTSSVDISPDKYNNDIILPKEEKLLEIVKKEHSESRKVWIYCDFNNGGEYMNDESLPNRLQRMLKENGFKVFQLKPSVKTYDRKEVIDKNKDDYDVFISNMKLVEVGINMVFCPTYIYYMPSYFINSVSQSSRRGMRANSTMENRIYHLYYENTLENKIMKRYERKAAESKAIVGRFDVVIENDKDIRTISKMANKINSSL